VPEPRHDERAAPPPLRLDPRLLLGGVLALVLLAGVASSGVLWRHAGGSPLVDTGSGRGIVAVVLLAAVVGVAILMLLTASVTLTRGGWRSLLLLVLVVGALLYALTLLPHQRPVVRYARTPTARVTGTTAVTTASGRARPFHVGRVGAWWWAAGLGVAALALAALELRRRQAPLAPEAEPDAAEDVLAAVEVSLAEIEREADPRLAVIKAYARMESTLATSGVPRRAVETSLEYMARALGALRVTRQPVERLTALFHEAKYSRHRVDPGMKADAIAALVAIRDQLGMET
jgi:Domain of unknown function (DUF4129)